MQERMGAANRMQRRMQAHVFFVFRETAWSEADASKAAVMSNQ
jgi:hypothetical protein